MMVEIDYEYKGGILFVRVNGSLGENNYRLVVKSIRGVIERGGILYTVVNLERDDHLNEEIVKRLLNDSCDRLLKNENNIFNYING